MSAAAEHGIDFVVLDRPNPLTVWPSSYKCPRREVQIVRRHVFDSDVYGMTCGELAMMVNGEGWLEGGRKCRLTVIPMEGWRRSMWWEETGLPWVPTSPHIPYAATSLFCAATGMIGELDGVSVGIGYTLPFQLVGAPWIDAARFARALNGLDLPGVHFRPTVYTPFYGAMQGKQVSGVQNYVTDRSKANLVNLQLYSLQAIDELYRARDVFAHSDSSRLRMFDSVMERRRPHCVAAEDSSRRHHCRVEKRR